MAIDYANGFMWAHVNGTWLNNGTAVAPANAWGGSASQSGFSGSHFLALAGRVGTVVRANFGQDPSFDGARVSSVFYSPTDGIGRFRFPVPQFFFALTRANASQSALKSCGSNEHCDGVCLVDAAVATPVNLAPSATIDASSTYGGFPTDNMTDGLENTAWRSISSDSTPILNFDLGETRFVEKVRLLSVNANYGTKDVSVWGSHDGAAWTRRSGSFTQANDSAWLEFSFDGLGLRFIDVDALSNFSTTAGLAEVEIIQASEGFCGTIQGPGGACDETNDCAVGLECVGAICQQLPSERRHSLVLDADNQGKLSHTVGQDGDRQTWSFSAWLKRGQITTTDQVLLNAQSDASNTASLSILGSASGDANKLKADFNIAGTSYGWVFDASIGDTENWHHVLVTVDTANRLGENNRPRLYLDNNESIDYTASGNAASGFQARHKPHFLKVTRRSLWERQTTTAAFSTGIWPR